jgi:hypothetical protein
MAIGGGGTEMWFARKQFVRLIIPKKEGFVVYAANPSFFILRIKKQHYY